MTQFAQPWSMDCSYEQVLEVKPLLEEMGYYAIKVDDSKVSIIFSNYAGTNNCIETSRLNNCYLNEQGRLYLGSFHKELLLAIAAMRTDGWHKGEAVVCINDDKTHYFTKGYLYQILSRDGDDRIRILKDDEGTPNGWLIKNFRKATAQEIIDYFRNDKRVFDVGGPVQEEEVFKIQLLQVNININGNLYRFTPEGISARNPNSLDSIYSLSVEALEAAIKEYRKYFNQ